MLQMLASTGLSLGLANVKLVTQFTEQFFLTLYLMYPHKENSLDVKNMPRLDNHLSCHKHPRQAGLTEFNLV